MNTHLLDAISVSGFFLAALAFGLLALEIGYRIGSWRHVHAIEEKEVPVGAMVASVLALLAFMLAFTFGLAASRFDARRQVVVDEANAIGTTWLRSRLLPEPQKSEAARLLREYVDVRVRFMQEGKIAEGIAIRRTPFPTLVAGDGSCRPESRIDHDRIVHPVVE